MNKYMDSGDYTYDNEIEVEKECDCEECQCGDYFDEVPFDQNSYFNGINDGSYFAGYYGALRTAGMSDENAAEIIMRKMDIDFNMQVALMNKDLSERLAKKEFSESKFR